MPKRKRAAPKTRTPKEHANLILEAERQHIAWMSLQLYARPFWLTLETESTAVVDPFITTETGTLLEDWDGDPEMFCKLEIWSDGHGHSVSAQRCGVLEAHGVPD